MTRRLYPFWAGMDSATLEASLAEYLEKMPDELADVIQMLRDELATRNVTGMCCITCFAEATAVVVRDGGVMIGACGEHVADARAFGPVAAK